MKLGIFIDQLHFGKMYNDYGYTSIDSFIKVSGIQWVSPSSPECEAIVVTENYLSDRRWNKILKPKILFISEPFETNAISLFT